jgi:hypothetical protein
MAENLTAMNNGTVQPVQTGGIITDPKILQGLTKAYNGNCKKLLFIIGKYYLEKFLSGGDEYKTELFKIKTELKSAADKKQQRNKNGDDIITKEERESMFVADQLGVFQIYQAIYKREQDKKAVKAKGKAEKKA